MKQKLAIAVRIFGPQIPKPNILGLDDKLEIIKRSLKSLRHSLIGKNFRLILIMDAPVEYWSEIMEEFPKPYIMQSVNKNCGVKSYWTQIETLCNQTDCEFVYLAEDDYLYSPLAWNYALDFMKTHAQVDAVSLAYHAQYENWWSLKTDFKPIEFAGYDWHRQVTCSGSFLIRRKSLIEAAPIFTNPKLTADLANWMSLTKLRVCNPWSLIRGWQDGIFIPGSIALAWWHNWRQILNGKQFLLYAPKPTLATHIEKSGAALDWW